MTDFYLIKNSLFRCCARGANLHLSSICGYCDVLCGSLCGPLEAPPIFPLYGHAITDKQTVAAMLSVSP